MTGVPFLQLESAFNPSELPLSSHSWIPTGREEDMNVLSKLQIRSAVGPDGAIMLNSRAPMIGFKICQQLNIRMAISDIVDEVRLESIVSSETAVGDMCCFLRPPTAPFMDNWTNPTQKRDGVVTLEAGTNGVGPSPTETLSGSTKEFQRESFGEPDRWRLRGDIQYAAL